MTMTRNKTLLQELKNHPAYIYAKNVVVYYEKEQSNKKVKSPKEIAGKDVYIVCKQFIEEIKKNNKGDWFFSLKTLSRINSFLKLINMAKGVARGQTVYSSLFGFQWFFIVNILCWKTKEDHSIRRYQTATMLIARKNSKTFLSAIIFILLLLLEPKYSHFYSVAPDRELSGMIKAQIEELLDSSPALLKYFKVTRKKITCVPKQSDFENLANSNDRLDGREPSVFLSDETGALPNNYPVEAMRSGQILIPNKLGIIISTAYTTLSNPMTQEIEKAEDKINKDNGKLYDPRYFALIYKPDRPEDWKTDDIEMLKANPLAQHIKETKEYLIKKRDNAVVYPAERQNFLTKHMNVFVDGKAGEQFVTEAELDRCVVNDYDWSGRHVYVGLDFAESNDNFGLSMVTYDDSVNKFVAKSWSFYPSEKETEKSKIESIDYHLASQKGWSIPMGQVTIDYGEAEEFFLGLEKTYGVIIEKFGYDKWNARSSVARFQREGYVGVEVPQNVSGLYPGTKLLREAIENEMFAFEKNDMLKQNFLNARMVTDMNMSYFLNKKQSKGKIDMVASLVDAMALYQLDEVESIAWGNVGATVF